MHNNTNFYVKTADNISPTPITFKSQTVGPTIPTPIGPGGRRIATGGTSSPTVTPTIPELREE